ncbi:DNA polymerase IV [Nocardioides sp. Bht2]|uniref:DNA polymerase IV n=1 Tax=Nocardioides sp. Bht2 TaxID=3392297 RepID=UPI0039B65CC1
MRSEASVLHLDLDAFFAAVEQRDKPSLRGKPVVVGGTGGRGVVSTASYEARAFGVRSAMSTREARSRCPHAAYLGGRFDAYRAASKIVMAILRSHSPLVEPLSIDEAFVDLAACPPGRGPRDFSLAALTDFGQELRAEVAEATGGLTASVGIGSSKFIAKVASELDKPDGLRIVETGTERALLRPMQATVIPGVGPATSARLRRIGVQTVAELEAIGEDELVSVLGKASGTALFRLARAEDDREIEAEREAKSVSVEGTYATDLTDPAMMAARLTRFAGEVARRLRRHGLSGRTVSIKVRLYDFTTLNRSATLTSPTDDAAVIARLARGLLTDLDTTGGVRLLGVGVSGLADWVQDDLFGDAMVGTEEAEEPELPEIPAEAERRWTPGMDVAHTEHGRGWVWGSGRGVVTVRFETAASGPGPVRSFSIEDTALSAVGAVGAEPAEETTDGPVEGFTEPE